MLEEQMLNTQALESDMTDDNGQRSSAAPAGPRGLLIVMTGASGVGKGTLREQWLAEQDVFYSVSWTPAPPAPASAPAKTIISWTPNTS